jgi:tRNA modification GTPase
MFDSAETITAISTAVTGTNFTGAASFTHSVTSISGGIGIVRLSGTKSLPILQRLFSKKIHRTKDLRATFAFTPRKLEHGWIYDAESSPLDEVLAVFMPGPHTFTGEDVAEIHCHGGKAVLQAILASTITAGARLAEPGEFTRRAFLNGRLDLSQAEAVAEMIASPTLQGVYLARNKLEGRLSSILNSLRAELDLLRARLYLCIDFPDEAEETLAQDTAHNQDGTADFISRLNSVITKINALLLAYERAAVWREGARAALAGRVNVGKSSLLNALLGRKRALVSPRPGTTRDFIEEPLNLGGLPLRLVDTAGLRKNGLGTAIGELEAEGMDFARELFAEADIILLVLEAQQFLKAKVIQAASLEALDPESKEIFELYGPGSNNSSKVGTGKLFIILNKIDLCPGCVVPEEFLGCPCQAVSAKEGTGLDSLAAALRTFILSPAADPEGNSLDFTTAAVPGLRQTLKLKEVKAELSALKEEFQDNIPADLLSVRLDSAAAYLADVTGASCTEEILDQVFANFCIGK